MEAVTTIQIDNDHFGNTTGTEDVDEHRQSTNTANYSRSGILSRSLPPKHAYQLKDLTIGKLKAIMERDTVGIRLRV